MEKQTIQSLTGLVSSSWQNENIIVSVAEIKPSYSPEYLDELEASLNIKYNEDLRNLYTSVGEISLSWFVNSNKFAGLIPEEEINYLGGGIALLNPFDMVMGKGGERWKNELWFDAMDSEEKQQIRSFIPFDFANPNLVAGFQFEGNETTNKMRLLHSSDGISDTPLQLEEYLNLAVKTKGLAFWQLSVNNKTSDGYNRLIRYMPMLFDDLDVDFLTNR